MNASSWTLLKKCAALGTGIATVAGTTIYANTLRENGIIYSSSQQNEITPVPVLPPKSQMQLVHGHDSKLISIAPSLSSVVTDCASSKHDNYIDKLHASIAKARSLCETVKDEFGLPGLVISVAVNGKPVWEEGFGYADLENHIPMTPDSVLRIASISKSMTAAMMGKLIEEGKIDIDLPIQTYIPKFPEKEIDGKKVVITTRHLLSHLSGIRHYLKKGEKENDEMENQEYFLKNPFKTVDEALVLFQGDELYHAPGTKYHYTTHGFTVVSRIIETITKLPFDKYSKSMFSTWGLKNTYLDVHETLIYNRARCYTRTKKGRIINSPYVDNSYKWAGGGFLSTVRDLTQFAHMLLYSYQHGTDSNSRQLTDNQTALSNAPYLKKSTITKLWSGDLRTREIIEVPTFGIPDSEFLYGLGFVVEQPFRKCDYGKESELLTIGHSGGAIGASSILFIRIPPSDIQLQQLLQQGHDEVDPNKNTLRCTTMTTTEPNVQGLVIVMITNLTAVGLSKTAYEISNLFSWLI